jgi:hypothetical protein
LRSVRPIGLRSRQSRPAGARSRGDDKSWTILGSCRVARFRCRAGTLPLLAKPRAQARRRNHLLLFDCPAPAAFAARDQIHLGHRCALMTTRMSARSRQRHLGWDRVRLHQSNAAYLPPSPPCGLAATLATVLTERPVWRAMPRELQCVPTLGLSLQSASESHIGEWHKQIGFYIIAISQRRCSPWIAIVSWCWQHIHQYGERTPSWDRARRQDRRIRAKLEGL